jgi:peptidoglycan/LPS O-acetylase OafA/YrhL
MGSNTLTDRPVVRAVGNRQDFLDGIRGLAALYVVLHHTWLEIWPADRFPSGRVMALTGWLMWGHLAVTIFIVISGYCLTLPVVLRPEKPFRIPEFFKRRAKRILPAYYFGFLLTGILLFFFIGHKTGTHWDIVLPPTPRSIILGLLLQPDIEGTINHAYWSIGVECKIYLLFPLIVFLQRRVGVWTTAATASWITFPAAFAIRNESWAAVSPHYLAIFCWGSAAAYVVNSPEPCWRKIRGSRLWVLALVAAAIATVFLCYSWGWAPQRIFALDALAGAGGVALLVVAGRSGSNPLRNLLSGKPLVLLGGFSYSLYLVHAPLIQVVWQYLISVWFREAVPQFLGMLGIGVPLIVLSAWVFYRFCEKPFMPR